MISPKLLAVLKVNLPGAIMMVVSLFSWAKLLLEKTVNSINVVIKYWKKYFIVTMLVIISLKTQTITKLDKCLGAVSNLSNLLTKLL